MTKAQAQAHVLQNYSDLRLYTAYYYSFTNQLLPIEIQIQNDLNDKNRNLSHIIEQINITDLPNKTVLVVYQNKI